jgi:Uma2 family endonuclease
MMAASTQISVEEYLHTSYRPDCDYVDGEVRERNVGEHDHSRAQALLIGFLGAREKEWGIVVLPSMRVRVNADRYRVADVCVLREDAPHEQIIHTPPLICIEILSKDDTFASVTERLDDYVAMGVANVWVIDPQKRRAYTYSADGTMEAINGELRVAESSIAIPPC